MLGPKANRGEGDGCEEVSRELVVAGGDPTEVLELVEEALDEVAVPVELAVDDASDTDVALGGNVGSGAGGLDQCDDGAGEVATVGDDIAGKRHVFNERRQGCLVGGLAGRQQQADRQTPTVDDGVDLGAQSPTRAADGVIRAPLFPPAACWCARTIEESIR